MQLSSLIIALVFSITALAAPLPLSTGSDVAMNQIAKRDASALQHLEARGEKTNKVKEKVKAAGGTVKVVAGSAAGPAYRAGSNAVRKVQGKETIPTAKKTKTRVADFAD